MPWQQLKIYLRESEDSRVEDAYFALAEILENHQALAVSATDAGDEPIYEPHPENMPLWRKTLVTALFAENQPLDNLLALLKTELNADYQLEILADQAWERVCMDQFQPQCFGDRLWICPSWHDPDKLNIKKDAAIVRLDPGLAFGTGSHPTTRLCLDWLAKEDLQDKILIDYGAGSGILAIAAARLGAKTIMAVDIDPQALEATRENSASNGLRPEQLIASAPEAFAKKFAAGVFPQADIIIANILANPLIELAASLISHLKSGGKIALSGILTTQAENVMSAYRPAIQFSPVVTDTTGEWCRLAGIKT